MTHTARPSWLQTILDLLRREVGLYLAAVEERRQKPESWPCFLTPSERARAWNENYGE